MNGGEDYCDDDWSGDQGGAEEFAFPGFPFVDGGDLGDPCEGGGEGDEGDFWEGDDVAVEMGVGEPGGEEGDGGEAWAAGEGGFF